MQEEKYYNKLDFEAAENNLVRSYQMAKLFIEKIKNSKDFSEKDKIHAEQISYHFKETYENYKKTTSKNPELRDLDWITEVWKTKSTIENLLK